MNYIRTGNANIIPQNGKKVKTGSPVFGRKFFIKKGKYPLIFGGGCGIIIKLFLGVAQLVARYLGVVEAGCSSHLTQTNI